MRKERSAGFVIFKMDGGKPIYLLLQNSSKFFWDFPKGNVDEGEDDAAAARRELMEEAGMTRIRTLDGFREIVKYVYKFRDQIIDKELVMFLAEALDDRVKISWEHSDYQWAPFDVAMSLLKDKKADVLQRANDYLSSQA